ncbi:putative PIF1 helicase-like protein [Leptomonas seymouri]|uniref:ATP-dependent DNA helicase n=1 Tax=Leptomonas seymouri TaxID=5684 RepID=A0A0N0P3C2_LEPSE|nr:putative PIF1 helicase-like protein [Leptomonas seymouri]|eukprot:KPI83497.1 putative PIF1 helicase-like protein [Leptomonas seymouri]
MEPLPPLHAASPEARGSASGPRMLLPEMAPSTTASHPSLSSSPAPLISMHSSQAHEGHTPEAPVGTASSSQTSPSQSLYTLTSAPVSHTGVDRREGSTAAQSFSHAEEKGPSCRGLPLTTMATEVSPATLPPATTEASPQEALRNDSCRLDKDDVEEVRSCITLSSTTTSPTVSPPPPPPLLQRSSTLTAPRQALRDEEGDRSLLSARSSAPSLQTALTYSLQPNCTGIVREVDAGPALAQEPASAEAAAAVAHHAVDTPVAAYRVLDSEPSGRASRRKSETALDLLSDGAPRTSASSSNSPLSPTEDVGSASAATATCAAALSDEQRYAYRLAVHEHRNVFITGGAGTGKSHLLRAIIKDMPCSTTFVTATTGIAALNLSGTTLHSFVGCCVPDKRAKPSKLLSTVASNARCLRNWRLCRALVIDEVSMLEASFFDLVDYIARHVRNRPREPFGGIQLILSGDFLQLPPVVKERRDGSAPFCFETKTWIRVNPRICLLSAPFRQRDLRFFEILNEMRFGDLQPDSVALLRSITTTNSVHFARRLADWENQTVKVGLKRERGPPTDSPAGSSACTTSVVDDTTNRCSSTFYDVSARPGERQARLELVDGAGRAVDAPFDGYTILRSTRAEVDAQNEWHFRRLDTEIFTYVGAHSGLGAFPANNLSEVVRLRKGCRVMVIKNFDAQTKLVNGSTGTVTGFVSFAKGYRFLSLGITARDGHDICVGRGQDEEKRHTMLPLVAFDSRNPPGQTRMDEIVVEPQEWVEKEGDRVKSRSVQMPLVLAYAITIHKAQGMSLSQVDIDFSKVFEAGQAYVALSRCTDLQRVRLHGFHVHAVSANATALAYYRAVALQQRRLEWQRQHTPHAVADMEDVEARSCTPYGYVLPSEADIFRHYGGEGTAHGLFSDDDVAEEDGEWGDKTAKAEGSCCNDNNGVRGKCERQGEGQRSSSFSLHHPNAAADFDGDKGSVCETQRLDVLRRRITPLLQTVDLMKRLVFRDVLPLPKVRNTLLVMDIDAIFHLVTGAESATVFDILFDEQENMMRVPLCVQQLIAEAAAYRSSSESMRPSTTPEQPTQSQHHTRTPGMRQRAPMCDAGGSTLRNAPLLEASDVAAEALTLLARARQDFILDVQRPEQTAALPEPPKEWLRFSDVLPLLLRRPPASATGPPTDLVMGLSHDMTDADAKTGAEANFILHRDPREAVLHRAIIEYALFLKTSFGQSVAVCTDSIVLAAYALAWGLQAVSVVYLM